MPSVFDHLKPRIRRFLDDETPAGILNRSLAVLGIVTLVTAWFSETFFFPDEHYQVLEFMAFKLGITPAHDLPWEFEAHIRPWLQPFLYYLIAKPLLALGLNNLFTLAFILRLITGAFSMLALAVFARFMLAEFKRPAEQIAYARLLPFLGFLPYLFVRTASETMSAAFIALGLVLAFRASTARRMVLAGLLCGLAFECRFQTALITLGLAAWLVFQAKVRPAHLAAFVLGALIPVAAALPIDRWGYGVWCFPPWGYLDANVFQGVAAHTFGRSPFFAYLYLLPANIFFPIVAVMVIALIAACLRNPRHVLTWATVPFVLVHCVLAHKEERFLFPLVILATAYPILAFAPGRPFALFDRVWAWRHTIAAKFVMWSAVAAMLFLAIYPFGIRPHMQMAKYLYRNFPNGLTVYAVNAEPFASYPMYRPKPFTAKRLHSMQELEALTAKGPVYLFSETPSLPAPIAAQARLVYSEFGLARDPQWAKWATRVACRAGELPAKTGIHPPHLYWMTLFEISRSAPSDAAVSPCSIPSR